MILVIRLFLLIACVFGQAILASERLTIGVLVNRDSLETLHRWQPLADYLNQQLPDYHVELNAFSHEELARAIDRRQIDFVFSDAAHYIAMNELNSLSAPLATLIDRDNNQPMPVYGGAIVVRQDRIDIQSLSDLKGKTIATSSTSGLAMFLMQAYELYLAGIDIGDINIRQLLPVDRPVQAVLAGEVDAAFVRMGLIEQLAQETQLDIKRIKVLNARQMVEFGYAFSTSLYPGWPFAAMPQAPDGLAARVAAALLMLPHDGEVARAAKIWGFAVPANYDPVREIMQALRVPPFDQTPIFVLSDVWQRYRIVVILLIGAFVTILLLLGWLAISRQRLRAQSALLSDASHYARSLIEASLDPLLTISAAGKITDVNQAMVKATGLARQALIGSDFGQVFSDPEQARRGYQQVFAEGLVQDYPLTIRHVGGDTVDVLFNASLYRNRQGEAAGAFAAALDMTRQKLVESQLRVAKVDAEAASKTKSDFLSNMSHEIRTPINAIIGLTELTLDTQLNARQRDYLDKVQVASKSLLSIINDLLDFSKIEAGKIDIEHNPFAIDELVQDVIDLFTLSAESKGVELFVETSPSVPGTVIGDVMRIRQVLCNLLNNAIKFTDSGEVHLELNVAEHSDDRYVLSFAVRDTGIGLSQAEIEHLFQSFSQADASISRRFGGTGLGLAICRQLVELMGGQITVVSQKGLGSCFHFNLPVRALPDARISKTMPDLGGLRMLVVDDRETACLILRRYLESWGCQVDTTLSARQALHLIQQAEGDGYAYDMLLLDWQMPEMDGLQLAREIAELWAGGQLQKSPIILMVTGHSSDKVLQQADQGGVKLDAILTKPVSMSGLYNALLKVYMPEHIEVLPRMPGKQTLSEMARPMAGCCVLLVEDNLLNQLITREFLQKAGLRLVVAEQGAQAVDWVRRERFDAILMDLQMPVMDGFEAARRIRALPEGKDVPIIAMTAAAMQHDREACLQAGMNDHLPKPLNSKQLIATLLRWIKPNRQPSADFELAQAPDSIQVKTPVGFDFSGILPMLNGDFGHLFDVLKIFRNDYADAEQRIAGLIGRCEWTTAEREVHQLKGVAGNLGALRFNQASQRLDEQLKQQHCDAEVLQDWRRQFRETLQGIDDLLAAEQTPELQDRSDTDSSVLAGLAVRLDVLLAQNDFVSSDLLAEFQAALGFAKRERFKSLVTCIKKLDYVGARAILAELVELSQGSFR